MSSFIKWSAWSLGVVGVVSILLCCYVWMYDIEVQYVMSARDQDLQTVYMNGLFLVLPGFVVGAATGLIVGRGALSILSIVSRFFPRVFSPALNRGIFIVVGCAPVVWFCVALANHFHGEFHAVGTFVSLLGLFGYTFVMQMFGEKI